MWFLDQIISRLCSVSDQFLDAYEEVKGWIFPFWYLSYPLYYLYIAFYYLTLDFGYFNDWVDALVLQLAQFFTWSNLEQWFKDWKTKILDAWNWFNIRWSWFTSEVTDWWAETVPTVKGWISVATEGLDSLKVSWSNFWKVTWPQWTKSFNDLLAKVSSFFTTTLPTLVDWKSLLPWWMTRLIDVADLINSAFTEREPFWKGWQDVASSAIEFFGDPLGWLKEHIFEPMVDDFNRGFDKGLKGR